MNEYAVCAYTPRFDADHMRIGAEAAREWIWPYAHDAESLERLHSLPSFDPDLWLYAILDDEVVGFVGAMLDSPSPDKPSTATIFFPRTMPSHGRASELLLQEILDMLARRGVARVTGRVTTMCPEEISLAGTAGFALQDWGYKLYYSYEAKRGHFPVSEASAGRVDLDRDLEACAELSSRWYKQSTKWCLEHLRARHDQGIIGHFCVRRDGEVIASCLTAPNEIRPTTAALYYIYAPDEMSLKALVSTAANACIEQGASNLVADLIHEHRAFEPVYQSLGFTKVAEWARCSKLLAGFR